LNDDTQLIGVVDMVIQAIRDYTATRVNFVAPAAAASPSAEQKGESVLKGGVTPGIPAEHAAEAAPGGLLFVPLPITTPLYQNARFFLARDDGDKGTRGKGTGVLNHLVIGIDTENLGQLWFNIALNSDSLLVKCFAEKEEVSRYIKTGFPDLQASLAELAFSRVDLLSFTDPTLEHLERPGSQDGAAGGLVDVEV